MYIILPDMKARERNNKWSSIVGILRQEIACGDFKKGDRFITIEEISRRFNVSDIVGRRVLQELAKEGSVINKPRCGSIIARSTYVKEIPVFLPEKFCEDTAATPLLIFKIISSIEQEARNYGLQVKFISNCELLSNPEQVILVLYDLFNDIRDIINNSASTIIFVHSPKKINNFHTVRHGLFEGAYLATKHLIEKGYRKIGFIGGLFYDWYIARFQGYLEALKEYGLGIDVNFIKQTSDYDREENCNAFQELLRMKDSPDAVMCANDNRAIHILEYCSKKGIKVPEEIGICGFDNIPEGEFTNPGLTTVDTRLDEVGKNAVVLAMKIMEKEVQGIQDIVIKPVVVIRRST
ncbi:MAG TPA: substrate-binding domain-containing protein [Candidatus Ratteibacteria bacterium]|nr:substrate-binding domain-containing protein [Candidatus Ratteibacteria bacterium]